MVSKFSKTTTMKVFALLVAILFAITSAELPDYYWREFEGGIVPSDALIGTFDGQSVTYIGNAPIHGGGLFPGQLYPGHNNITVTGYSDDPKKPGPVFVEHDNIQVLCSGHRDRFEWVQTNDTELHLIKNVVPGGYEEGALYIGRVVHGGSIKIGKVVGYVDLQYYLFIPSGNEEIQYGLYEVLTYKP